MVKRRHILYVVLALLGIAAYTVLLHQAYTWRGNTHPDFYIEWTGSRVALKGGNPYSKETTQAIQIGSKGHLLPPEEDQLAFVSPFYRVFFNAPVAFLPYDWAAALWHVLMQSMLVAGVLLFIRSLSWHASPSELMLLMLVTFFAYPTFGGIMLGQVAIGVLALLLIAFWAMRHRHDSIAGCCLALATVKPHLALLPVLGILLWASVRQRPRVLIGFATTLAGLASLSFAFFPAWLKEFVLAVSRYPTYKNVQTGPGFLLSGHSAPVWAWTLEVGAIVGMLATWRTARRYSSHRWMEGAFATTMAMTTFVLPQTSPVDRMFLLPALLLFMRDASTWLGRVALAILAVGGTWALYAFGYRTHYNLNMALPSLVVVLSLAAWYVQGYRLGQVANEGGQ